MRRRVNTRGLLLLGFLAFSVMWIRLTGCASSPSKSSPTSVDPAQPRVVSYNIFKCIRGREGIIDTLRRLDGDFILLQEINEPDAKPIADALGMKYVFARDYPRDPRITQGQAILSKDPMTNVRSIADWDDHSCGVAADCTIDGKKVMLMSVHLLATTRATLPAVIHTERWRGKQLEAIRKLWTDAGQPSLILGGDFNQLPIGHNYGLMNTGLLDALAWVGKTGYTCNFHGLKTRIDYVLVSTDWNPVGGQVVDSSASDHLPIWADIRQNDDSTGIASD
jgi:endonuclease/exonuclease/phosphatase family metal-dependent hydrolase